MSHPKKKGAVSLLAKCFVLVATFISLMATAHAANIVVQRTMTTDRCTIGRLSVDGQFVCETLELPVNVAPWKRVPNGEYKAKQMIGPHGWRLELIGVPGMTNVQIHIGNSPRDTQGCTLVGYNANAHNGTIENSATALTVLHDAVRESADTDITVRYIDPTDT